MFWSCICLISRSAFFLLHPSSSVVMSLPLFLTGVMQIPVKMFYEEWWIGDRVPKDNWPAIIYFPLGAEVRVSNHLNNRRSFWNRPSWRNYFYMHRNNRKEGSEGKKENQLVLPLLYSTLTIKAAPAMWTH